MLTLLVFIILLLTVFGKILSLAIRAAWGITKIFFSIVFLPLVLIGMFAAGLTYLAIPILIVIGLVALLKK